MITLLFFSALAGFVTVLSPCILPILPVLLAANVGQGKHRAWGIILGLILSFTFFTLSLASIVHATSISPEVLRYSAIALIICFGLTMLFPQLERKFARLMSGITRLGIKVQASSGRVRSDFWSGCILGIALGLLWTPCAGPILATVTTVAATQTVTWHIVLITLFYSIGSAVPMFLIMYGGNKISTTSQFLACHAEQIKKLFGILMIAGALAIAFHVDIVLQQFTARYIPTLSVEHNESIKKELEILKPTYNPNFSVESATKPQAPELVGISAWINSDPISIQKLRGKVILIDFWTYSCINCVRTLPYIKQWYTDYKNYGFLVLGVHTPEFEFEKNLANVQAAVARFGITYPVALDNEYKTWRNYNNLYWPAHYLIDQYGVVQYHHFGESNYRETENEIRKLLGLAPLQPEAEEYVAGPLTPETYLGYKRGDRYQRDISLMYDLVANYEYKGPLTPDHVGLKGIWFVGEQSIRAEERSTLDLSFMANRVYLVMESTKEQLVDVLLDGKPLPQKYYTADMNQQGQIKVHEARMYDIVDFRGESGRHTLTLQAPDGVTMYAFTFGAASQYV